MWQHLNKGCGNDAASIIALKSCKSLWMVIVDSKNATNSVAQAILTSDSSLCTKVKSLAYYGIVH